MNRTLAPFLCFTLGFVTCALLAAVCVWHEYHAVPCHFVSDQPHLTDEWRDFLWRNRDGVCVQARCFAAWIKENRIRWLVTKQVYKQLEPDWREIAPVVLEILRAENDPTLQEVIDLLTQTIQED